MESKEQYQSDRDCPSKPRGGSGLLTLLFIAVVMAMVIFAANSSLFVVGSVVVEGSSTITQEEILRIAGVPERYNIFQLNTRDIKERLSGDLRIANVDVSRSFPSTIIIHVMERKPLIYVATNYGFAEMDRTGLILAAYKNLRNVNIPILTGVTLTNQYVGDPIPPGPIGDVLFFLENLDADTFNQISEVNIRADGYLSAYTTHPIQIRLGGNERLADKAKLTIDILQEINQKKLAIDYIDMNSAAPIIKARK
ncbi:MAG: ftsQ [Firmicutes bacterium]|nr:ftsQ [Bacillota bacterium]